MMPETLRKEEDDEEERDGRTQQERIQTTDSTSRAKPHHPPCSQGPLSSLRAAIKRTKTSSQSGNRPERRRPNITIVSVEPLARNTWFTGGPVVFPPPAAWSPGIQTVSQPPPPYDLVVKETSQKDHLSKPTAAPRQSICKATSGTQTDPVRRDCGVSSPHAERNPAAKKPRKPPRSSLPRASEAKRSIRVITRTPEPTSEEGCNCELNQDLEGFEKADSQHRSLRSITVHWITPTDHQPDTAVSPGPAASNLESTRRPVPRPRTKLHKKPSKEEDQPLIRLEGNCDTFQSHSLEVPTNDCLEELLEVFGGRDKNFDKLDYKLLGEDAVVIMSGNQNHRDIHARIRAFESQTGAEEENGSQPPTPDLPPRRGTYKPPVASKPSVAVKPQSANVTSQSLFASQNQGPVTKPKPPTNLGRQSVREELEALHTNRSQPHRSRPFGLMSSNSVHEEEPATFPPVPPVKPFKEPLKPNLNINNHNWHPEDKAMDAPAKKVPLKHQYSLDSSEGTSKMEGIGKRPTTIRVANKPASVKMGLSSISDNFQDGARPLPVKKPISSMNCSAGYKQSLIPPMSSQKSFSTGPELPPPPKKPSVNKSLPPRPPPAKTGSGKPPPQSAPLRLPPRSQPQKPTKKGLVMPPRPSPGHRLYNSYMLPLPHAIASADFDGSNTGELTIQKNEVLLLLEKINHNEFECQIGETTGKVHKSRMKIITPLDSSSSFPQDDGATASGGGGEWLKVKALHDFVPEGPSELRLKAGDVVTGVEQVDSQWYRGTCNGSTGFFPISYVKVLCHSPKPLPKKNATAQSGSDSGPRCVARFEFEGEHSDELSFSEGDVIQLKEYIGEDWARGQVGTSVGIFPLNYVEIVEDLPPPPSQPPAARVALQGLAVPSSTAKPAAAKPDQPQADRSGVEWGVALYDYAGQSRDELSFQRDDCILITQHLNEEWSCGRLNGREGMFPRAYIEAASGGQQSENQQNGAACSVRGKALYRYTSDCEEELSLQVGDIVTNLESVDDEWFLGDLRGKRALVPKNYVQVLD